MNVNKTNKSKNNIVIYFGGLLAIIVLFFLTHDIIITNFLSYQICALDPQPKTFITKTIEYPESIYWEDNIYPGFDEQDRLLMIRNYLDGVHLKTMMLNAPDGTIYLYTATENNWEKSRNIKSKRIAGDYFDMLDQEAKLVAMQGKEYSRQTMPSVSYSVTFNPIPLTKFQHRYLWSDEVSIKDERKNEIIGYNRRLMRKWYMILPDIGVGNRYYSPKPMCGENNLQWFDEGIFVGFSRNIIPSKHREFLDNKLNAKE